MSWTTPPDKISLPERTVDIWRIPLQANDESIKMCRARLSPDEIVRANRFLKEIHRQRYILGRGKLRQLLARYREADPAELRFRYSDHGKPDLTESGDGRRLRFNLSHSADMAVAAVVWDNEIGIDIEFMRSNVDFLKLANRFFAKSEAEAMRETPTGQRKEMFFRIWTRKEAYIKAHGEGLSLPLDEFEVSTGADEPPALLQTHFDPEDKNRWSLAAIEIKDGYQCTLACEGSAHPLRFWDGG